MGETPTHIEATPNIAPETRARQPAGNPKWLAGAATDGNFTGWLWLLLLVALGTFLRFYMLGVKSLWLDEASSVWIVHLRWPEFLRLLWWGEANMALYYFLLRGWIHLGSSELWLRSLSALFGVAAIPATYAFGTRFLGRKVGFMAAALLAVHSFHIHYSQDLRSYSLVTLLLILSSYAFLIILETPGRTSSWMLYIASSTLAIYAHVFAAFVLVSQWLVPTPRKIKRLGANRVLAAAAAMGALIGPIAAVVVREHKEQLNWVPAMNLAGLLELVEDLLGAGAASSEGTVRGLALLTVYVATWVVALVIFFRARRNGAAESARRMTVPLLVSWFIFPIIAMMGISLSKPILYPRYVAMCVPAAVLLAAWGLAAVAESVPRGRWVSAILFLIMAGLTLRGAWDHYASFKTYGNDWRGVTRYILSHAQHDDAIVFFTPSGYREYLYYVERERGADTSIPVPVALFPLPADTSGIQNHTRSYPRVWLVLHQLRSSATTDAQTSVIRAALESQFPLLAERTFPGSGGERGENGTIRVALYADRHLLGGPYAE